MARERVIACENYICEENCKEGKEGTFWKKCQKCKSYKPVAHGTPARIDNKFKKMKKIIDRESKDWNI